MLRACTCCSLRKTEAFLLSSSIMSAASFARIASEALLAVFVPGVLQTVVLYNTDSVKPPPCAVKQGSALQLIL